MPKIPKHVKDTQRKMFLQTKKDYPHRMYTIVDVLHAASLMDPKLYPYENRNRLCRIITDGCIDAIDQATKLMGFLPQVYRNEIVKHAACSTLREWKFQEVYEGLKAGKPYNPDDFVYYQGLLDQALLGINTMMPPQFTQLLWEQVRTFQITLASISEFSTAHNLQNKVPQYTMPEKEKEKAKPS